MDELDGALLDTIDAVLRDLSACRKKRRLFPQGHSLVTDAVNALAAHLGALLDKRPRATFSLIENQLYVEGDLMAEESMDYAELIAALETLRIHSLTIERGVTTRELAVLIDLTNEKPENIEAQGGWDAILERESVSHLTINRVAPVGLEALDSPEIQEKRKNATEVYDAAIRAVMGVCADVRAHRAWNAGMVDNVVEQLVVGMTGNEEAFLALTTLKDRHEYTFYHSLNVAILSVLMAMKMKLDTGLLHRLGVAALLHDIGKLQIPDEILDKPGGLSDAEWKVMQSHPLEGAKLLSEQSRTDELAVTVAAQHHLHYDLGGYPQLPGLDRVSLIANTAAVADTYDALTSDRSYRRAMLPDRALAIVLDGRGTHYHPGLVRVFTSVTGIFPVGTCVELDTGELGVVVKPNPDDLSRPQVRLVAPGEGPAGIVDLAAKMPNGEYPRTILRAVDPAEKQIDASCVL